jgi:hypothetical protein
MMMLILHCIVFYYIYSIHTYMVLYDVKASRALKESMVLYCAYRILYYGNIICTG